MSVAKTGEMIFQHAKVSNSGAWYREERLIVLDNGKVIIIRRKSRTESRCFKLSWPGLSLRNLCSPAGNSMTEIHGTITEKTDDGASEDAC